MNPVPTPNTPMPPVPPERDLLGVLTTTWPVLAAARDVWLDHNAITATADALRDADVPGWDATLHWRDPDDSGRTAAWVMALDALNFCFWAPTPDAPRWAVRYRGERYDGYWGLAVALSRAMDDGVPLTDPEFLATISKENVKEIFRPDELQAETPEIPLLDKRVAHLRELGQGWQALQTADSRTHPALTLIAAADGSAARLVTLVAERFPSFRDVATYAGAEVRLYKRAQILAGDLAGTFNERGPGAFHDLQGLTAFADYKVPQVLRRFRIVQYSDQLTNALRAYQLIPAGSPPEVEIRAATVWGCELLRHALEARGRSLRAFEVDWLLWTAGQATMAADEPYHRTVTGFY